MVNIGGEVPLEFLAKAGVSMRRYHGESPGDAARRRSTRSAAYERRRQAAAERERGERPGGG